MDASLRLVNTQAYKPSRTKPQTTTFARQSDAAFVVALTESRGVSREVGLAALDQGTGRVTIAQLADFPTYVKTLHQLHIHAPALVIVPDTFISFTELGMTASIGGRKRNESTSLLVHCIRDEFPGVTVEPVLRRYWNETAGLEFIHQLCVEDDERAAVLIATSSKYYALSAVSALLKFVETKLNIRYASGSLRMRYIPVEGTMMIDPDTARNLELVNNMSSKKSSHSLFGVLNYTFTAMGARLLRVNLLSPLTTQPAIDARLDAVEELVQNEDSFADVKEALKSLNKIDFDKLISALSASEARVTTGAKAASSRVVQMLSLRSMVKSIPALSRALEGSRSRLLKIICETISDARLAQIATLVDESLNEEATPAKSGLNALNARVYAVKANQNRLLDVARETYKENVGDIFALSRSLAEKHELPLQLLYQDSAGGFVFSLKKSDLEDVSELNNGFVNVVIQRGRIVFSSLELQKRNARMKDALDESLILSDKIIQDMVSIIISDIGALYKASEAIALLDMLWAYAHSTILRNYVRPEFTGTLAVKGGRHPILECITAAGIIVPNDVYCSDAASFQIIQGPNMSGKSTYLRLIGLLTVMAMCGCFIPAEYGSFRLHDTLLTRLSNDDDIEKNLSTFANEMATSAMILGLVTSKSLVLIDELGRGTAPREGVGISHAIAESLVSIKCFVFFTTHFQELSITLSQQPSVVNLHLTVNKSRRDNSAFKLVYHYKVADGAVNGLKHYGIEQSKLADLPFDVLREGHRIAEELALLDARQRELSTTNRIAQRRKVLLTLRTQLTQAYEHSSLPDEELISFLARVQQDVTSELRKTL